MESTVEVTHEGVALCAYRQELRCLRHVEVAGQLGIDVSVSLVYHGREPLDILHALQLVYAVNLLAELRVDLSAGLAVEVTVHKIVAVDGRSCDIVCVCALQWCTVTLYATVKVNLLARAKWHWIGILADGLVEEDFLLVAIGNECQLSVGYVLCRKIFPHALHGTFRTAEVDYVLDVAGESSCAYDVAFTVETLNDSKVDEILDAVVGIVTHPSCYGTCIAVGGNLSRIDAVAYEPCGCVAVVASSHDGTCVRTVHGCHVSFVDKVLHSEYASCVLRPANKGSYPVLSCDGAGLVDDKVLDCYIWTIASQHSEESHALLLGEVEDHVCNSVALSVPRAVELVSFVGTYGVVQVLLALEVDVVHHPSADGKVALAYLPSEPLYVSCIAQFVESVLCLAGFLVLAGNLAVLVDTDSIHIVVLVLRPCHRTCLQCQ